MAKPKINSKETMTAAKDAAMGIVGGIIANQISNAIEKQPWLARYAKYAPILTGIIGGAAYLFSPANSPIRKMALGVMIVSGTEKTEELIGSTLNGEHLTLGYTPSYMPEIATDAVAMTDNGVSYR